jgi:hypothetical protein
MTKYIYKKITLSKEEALKRRDRQVEALQDRILALYKERAEASVELITLLNSELDCLAEVQHALNPGDPGYEEAPVRFNEGDYQGQFAWIDIDTSEKLP